MHSLTCYGIDVRAAGKHPDLLNVNSQCSNFIICPAVFNLFVSLHAMGLFASSARCEFGSSSRELKTMKHKPTTMPLGVRHFPIYALLLFQF